MVDTNIHHQCRTYSNMPVLQPHTSTWINLLGSLDQKSFSNRDTSLIFWQRAAPVCGNNPIIISWGEGRWTSRLAVRWLIVKPLLVSCSVLQSHKQKSCIVTVSGPWHIILANIGIIQTSQPLFFWFKNIQGSSNTIAHSPYSALLHLCHPNILLVYLGSQSAER